MQELQQAIVEMGQGIGQSIVKVDQFLNHRIDTGLVTRMGQEIAARYAAQEPDLVLTIEASGIALALAAAHALGDIPMVFAKKSQALNQGDEMKQAQVYSFTHRTVCHVRVDPRYVPIGSRVLIVDDFLADGEAVRGMMSLVQQCGAQVVGVAIAIEKGFQPGGQRLRAEGIPLLSLAVIDEIRDGKFRFREN